MAQNSIIVSAEVLHFIESAKRLVEVGSHRSAAEQLEHAVVLCSDSSVLWERLGTCYREQQEVARAEYCYVKAQALDPDSFNAAFHWGVLKMDLHQWDEAAKHFADATRLNPHDATTFVNLATALLQLGRKSEWKATMEQALALDPSIQVPSAWKPYVRGHQ